MSGVFNKQLIGPLKEAVYLRIEGKIDDARKKLYEACDQKDPLALFYLGYAYEYGGFGIDYTTQNEAFGIYYKAAVLGSEWAMARLVVRNEARQHHENFCNKIIESKNKYALGLCMRSSCEFPDHDREVANSYLDEEARNNNPFAQVAICEWLLPEEMSNYPTAIQYLSSAISWHNESAFILYYALLLRFNIKVNMIVEMGMKQSIRFYLKQYSRMSNLSRVDATKALLRLHPRIISSNDLKEAIGEDINAKYLCGEYAKKFPFSFSYVHLTDVFLSSNNNCRNAIVTWLLISKNFLSRDMRRHIAKIVWGTRYEAKVWLKNN